MRSAEVVQLTAALDARLKLHSDKMPSSCRGAEIFRALFKSFGIGQRVKALIGDLVKSVRRSQFHAIHNLTEPRFLQRVRKSFVTAEFRNIRPKIGVGPCDDARVPIANHFALRCVREVSDNFGFFICTASPIDCPVRLLLHITPKPPSIAAEPMKNASAK